MSIFGNRIFLIQHLDFYPPPVIVTVGLLPRNGNLFCASTSLINVPDTIYYPFKYQSTNSCVSKTPRSQTILVTNSKEPIHNTNSSHQTNFLTLYISLLSRSINLTALSFSDRIFHVSIHEINRDIEIRA